MWASARWSHLHVRRLWGISTKTGAIGAISEVLGHEYMYTEISDLPRCVKRCAANIECQLMDSSTETQQRLASRYKVQNACM